MLLTLSIIVYAHWLKFGLGYAIGAGDVDIWIQMCRSTFDQIGDLLAGNSGVDENLPHLAKCLTYIESLEKEAPHIIEGRRPDAGWPEVGSIEFRSYGMRYRPELEPALKDVSFSVAGKEKIGVVGRTGGGKSSLIHAILRLVEPDSGSISIDGVDISTIGLHDLRLRICVVPQSPLLFQGSIRENLDPRGEHTDDEIWGAIRKAQLEEVVNAPTGVYVAPTSYNDPGIFWLDRPCIAGVGLDKWIRCDGTNLSAGQRQLVSLCRALLWRRRILILDEATANIDSKTDSIIQRILRTEFADTTVITIAHRLNTVMDSDRILVMDSGTVAEFDTPSNLLARDGYFAQLVASMEFNEAAA
ncbi:ATP-binding cassette glutathione S-conjugate transporter ycf1 [Coemansia biformis]|uniref:ATP-binding cassette glutathione S-conjugate transporter ycf1 n=1 Tax=Coemansia biformis TaxID=1286918 RepID=A0A9W7XU58_9FUNG|nr:ATP-binding cassette glutathione S-conjugate transporter ycf1 [Coemansia biformis]